MKKIVRNLLLVSLMGCMGVVIHPAAAPEDYVFGVPAEQFNNLSVDERWAIIDQLIVNQSMSVQCAFVHAAQKGFEWALAPLIARGAKPDAADRNGRTALYVAAQKGHEGVVRFLIMETGVNKDAVGRKGNTALHIAVQNGREGVVRFLIEQAKANIDAVNGNNNGWLDCCNTALHLAALMGNDDIVKILIMAGANINAVNKRGSTPLHLATAYNCEKVVRIFREAGARIGVVDASNRTDLLRAVQGAGPEFVINEEQIDSYCVISKILIDGFCVQLERDFPTRQYGIAIDRELQSLANLGLLPQEVMDTFLMKYVLDRDLRAIACTSKTCKKLADNEMSRRFPGVKSQKFSVFINPSLQCARERNIQKMVLLLEQALKQGYLVVPAPIGLDIVTPCAAVCLHDQDDQAGPADVACHAVRHEQIVADRKLREEQDREYQQALAEDKRREMLRGKGKDSDQAAAAPASAQGVDVENVPCATSVDESGRASEIVPVAEQVEQRRQVEQVQANQGVRAYADQAQDDQEPERTFEQMREVLARACEARLQNGNNNHRAQTK